MTGLLSTCQELFSTSDLYEVLGIDKNATASEVKRGYHKTSLKVHPDRVDVKDKELCTQKFQAVSKAYSILSDTEKRKIYDETGEVDDENDFPQDRDWYDYWRLLFAKISVKDIEEFEQKYKGSAEELEDLKSAYTDYEGDMDQIMDSVLCATTDDEPRFTKILTDLIKNKELPVFKAFTKEKKTKANDRKRRADKEASEAAALKAELGIGENSSLQALIQQNRQSRQKQTDQFLSDLEAKYAKPAKTKKGKKGK